MRISRAILTSTVLALLVGMPLATSPMAFAQSETDGKSDSEAPAGTAFGPRAGKAQPGQPQPKLKTETIATHGAWQVQCSEIQMPEGQTPPPNAKSCGMVQTAKNEKLQELALTIIVNRGKAGDKRTTMMRVLAPIGVFLPTGIPVEIDGAALPNRLQFTQCAPRVCEAIGDFSDETLGKFRKGAKSTFYIYAKAGTGIPMNVSLDGFAAALAALDKL